PTPLNPTPNPVITSLAGFAVWPFPSSGRLLRLGLPFVAADSSVDPVITSLAGFAGGRRPQALGGRPPMPADFTEVLAVSPRTPVSCSMGRKGQPNPPNAINCFLFFSLNALLMSTKGTKPFVAVNVPVSHWPVLR